MILAKLKSEGLTDQTMKNRIHNYKHLEQRRKDLRNNSTTAESFLWKYLQQKKLQGKKFRRQHSITNYIVDFYCPSEKLIIELDGEIHNNISQQNYDFERTKKLEALGFKVIRYENKQVFENLEQVLEDINTHLSK